MSAARHAHPTPNDAGDTAIAAARFIVFDWDGTAVADRQPDSARHLIGPLEQAVRHGVRPYIVTGTRHDWIATQLRGLTRDVAPRVIVCCNRGSEVFRLDPDGAVLLHRRIMTEPERQALLTLGTSLARPLTEAGHHVAIITDRLNRIKIDLLPDWTDPPKRQIETVVSLANSRYRDFGGLEGLLDATLRLVADVAPDLRVTSDAKHIEIGITDKSHSMTWILADVSKHGGTAADMVIVGDEFGPLGGIEGSDAKTAIPGAFIYSVGREPNGVPASITHLGGGPTQLVNILTSVIAGNPCHDPKSDKSCSAQLTQDGHADTNNEPNGPSNKDPEKDSQ